MTEKPSTDLNGTPPPEKKKLPTRLQSDFSGLDSTTKVEGAEPVEAAIASHGIVKESQVDILFMIEPRTDMYDLRSKKDRRLIRVKVHSKVKHALFSYTDFRITGNTIDEMAHKVEFAGGALAEKQCIMYGDAHDPGECAKLARRHYFELCQYMAGPQAG